MLFIGIFVVIWVGLFTYIFILNRKAKKNIQLLMEGKIDEYFEEIDKQIQFLNKIRWNSAVNIYLMNKSMGYTYSNRPQEALDLLKKVNTTSFNRMMKTLYCNHLLFNFLITNQMDQAKRTYTQLENFLQSIFIPTKIKSAVLQSLAIFEYKVGHKEQAEESFEVLKYSKNPIEKMYANYYLYLIAKDKNQEKESGNYLKEAKGLDKWKLIKEEVER